MTINEFKGSRIAGREQMMRRAVSQRHDGLGLRAAFLGAVCVAGVFAALGLLYTFG